jgi:hypothetical protein
MAWPSTLSNTYVGNSSASVASSRSELDAAIVAINDIIGSRGAVSGVASLDSTSKIPTNQIPTELITSGSQDLTLSPGSTRVAINDILNLEPRTVSQLTALSTPVTGDIAYCSNGNAGNACVAVYSVDAWKIVSLGGNISAT